MASTLRHAIEAERLGKRYRTNHDKWAVREVSFRVPQGASLGLVGPNGAGKSTLLKLLARTTTATTGRFRCAPPVASLLELGAGFHPDFSGRENALMNGVLLGRTRKQMRAKLPEIVEFAELADVIDDPVRTYSTGMAMRLGFATALCTSPQVLLLDEVFAVGDLRFQKKCVDRLFDFRAQGGTLVLCSHSLYDVRQICDQALWLQAGELMKSGEAASVTNAYAAWNAADRDRSEHSAADGGPRIAAARLCAAEGTDELTTVPTGTSIELRVDWRNPDARRPLNLAVTWSRQDGTLVSGLATHLDHAELRGPAGTCCLHLPELSLLAGSFTVTVYLFDEHGVVRLDEYVLPQDVVVTNDSREVGLVRLAHTWSNDASAEALNLEEAV